MSLASTNEVLKTSDDSDEGYLVGTVKSIADPLGVGRIKVDIPGMFNSQEGNIPWVGSHLNSPFGSGPNYGWYGSPQVGSSVRVKLQNGNANYGLKEADHTTPGNVPAKFKNPKTWGFRDPDGNEMFVDMESHTWEFTDANGTTVKYSSSGVDITVNGVANITAEEINLN